MRLGELASGAPSDLHRARSRSDTDQRSTGGARGAGAVKSSAELATTPAGLGTADRMGTTARLAARPPGQWWLPEPRYPQRSLRRHGCRWRSVAVGSPSRPSSHGPPVALLGSLGLFQTYNPSGDPPILPWLVVLSAIAVGVLALSGAPAARIAGIIVVFLAGGNPLGSGLTNTINHADGFASIGIGPFVEVAGTVARSSPAFGCVARPGASHS